MPIAAGSPEAPAKRSLPEPLDAHVVLDPDVKRSAIDWPVEPDGLRELLVRIRDDYGPTPLYVTENGSAYDDVVSADGAVHDTERVAFLRVHLDAVAGAIADGADVRGYFAWSLLDNFEWAWGYEKRFGIVRVDYDTLERTIKDSGHAYAQIIRDS